MGMGLLGHPMLWIEYALVSFCSPSFIVPWAILCIHPAISMFSPVLSRESDCFVRPDSEWIGKNVGGSNVQNDHRVLCVLMCPSSIMSSEDGMVWETALQSKWPAPAYDSGRCRCATPSNEGWSTLYCARRTFERSVCRSCPKARTTVTHKRLRVLDVFIIG